MRPMGWRSVLAGGSLLLLAAAANGAEIKWAKSFDAATALARESNKLIMADFYTDW